MSDADLKNLMIHVERIVRPIRATELRKLEMRREILTHLEAVLAEEKAIAADDSAAWDATLRRLGDPAILTRDIQKIVPLRERLIIWNAPKGGWKTPQETRLMTGLFGMSAWMQMAFVFAMTSLMFGWWPIAVRNVKKGLADPCLWPWESWKIAISLLALFLVLSVGGAIVISFRIVDLGAQEYNRRRFIQYCILNMAVVFTFRIGWLFMGAGPWTDLLWMPFLSIPLTACLTRLGRLLRPGIRDFGEWFALEIAK